jgi:prepilin peptidase CpaA
MIVELHVLAFLVFLSAASWQGAAGRTVSPVLVYTGVAVSLSLRALLGADVHVNGLLGLSAALLVAIALMLLRVAGGSELRLLLMAGAFLGPRDVVMASLVAIGVMLLTAGVSAALHRGPWRGAPAVRVLLAPHHGFGWSEGRVVVGTEGAAAAAQAVPVSPSVAIVVGAVAGWIL